MMHIFILLLVSVVVLGDEWSIPMPSKSSFQGFDAPSDQLKWSRAQQEARQGSQILLRKVQETLKSPSDYIDGDKHFRWLHRMADIFVDKKKGFEQLNDYNGYRVPIVMIGHKEFQFKSFEGDVIGAKTMGIDDVLNRINKGLLKFPKKFIAVGNMDENWGWASSCFMNRTASWGFSYDQSLGPMKSNHNKELLPFLDDPNLIMLVINQHHNITHPKVLTLPRGVFPLNSKYIWDTSLKVLRTGIKKQRLVTSGSSSWGPRPEILSCVKHQLGQDLFISTARLSKYKFMEMAASSYATLAVPGLGYDTFRLWESLTLGTMPILEKGVGFDRLLHKLPALLVEDFAEVTPEIVRQAYIECLYRVDEWEYKRLTQRFWVRLLYKVSETGDASIMKKLFPMSAVDDTFVRPMIPFDCSNGCGKGTKRPPKHSCAINPSLNWTEVNKTIFSINTNNPTIIIVMFTYSYHH
jgi:hypothetical protein